MTGERAAARRVPHPGRRSDAPTGVTGPIATRWAVAGIQNRARGQAGKHRKRRWFSRPA